MTKKVKLKGVGPAEPLTYDNLLIARIEIQNRPPVNAADDPVQEWLVEYFRYAVDAAGVIHYGPKREWARIKDAKTVAKIDRKLDKALEDALLEILATAKRLDVEPA